MSKFLNKNRGFTLVEMMITVLIFSIIVSAVIGVFVSAIRIQRYNLTYQQLLDQTSYVMEYMSRALRMAVKDDGTGVPCITADYNYQISPDGSSIKFINYKGKCQEFLLSSSGKAQVEFDNGGKIDLTSDDFEVTSLKFRLTGEQGGIYLDTDQPRVTILMKAQGRKLDLKPKITIQTTISQRNPDQ